MAEQDITTAIVKTLNQFGGVHAMRLNSGSRSFRMRGCEAGTPDVLALVRGGSVLWIETKTAEKGSKPSEAQEKWHAMAAELEHTVLVVRSVEEAVTAVLAAKARAA